MLATLDWRSKPAANTFATFVRDDEEFECLPAELPEYARRIVVAAVETGMRAGEIRRLRWADVDLGACELWVIQAKNKEFRIVPLAQALEALLEAMNAELTSRPTAAGLRGG